VSGSTPLSPSRFGHKGMVAATILKFIPLCSETPSVGGRVSRRAMSEVREERGLTYGIAQLLCRMDRLSCYLGQFLIRNNSRISEAIEVSATSGATSHPNGITQAELWTQRRPLCGGVSARVLSIYGRQDRDIRLWWGCRLDDLGLDYSDTQHKVKNSTGRLRDQTRSPHVLVQLKKLALRGGSRQPRAVENTN